MKKILIPTDFSDNAQKAIDYAVHLLEKETCIFYILHAHLIAPSAPENRSDAEITLKQIVQKLKKNKAKRAHIFKGILLTDTPLSAINVTMIDKNIDYLFMGTKGYSGIKEIFIGSTAVGVIKHLDHCPIIAVPSEHKYNLPNEIVLANDFKKPIAPQELAPLLALAKLWASTLDIVHIKTEKELTDAQKLNRQSLENNLTGIQYSFKEIKAKGTVSTTIRSLAKENKNVGMIAMLKNKHGFLEKLLHEAVIRNVVFTTEVPLLVLPVLE